MMPTPFELQGTPGPSDTGLHDATEPLIAIELDWRNGFRFEATFEAANLPAMVIDEPLPLGEGAGPNPVQLLTVAVASCLSASLLFALQKFKQPPGTLRTHAIAWPVRNERQRLRIGHLEVSIRLGTHAPASVGTQRAISQFEDFCVVTQSVRAAIPVRVQVFDGEGVWLGP